MKKYFLLLLSFVALNGMAQELKEKDAVFEDYLRLLNKNGYEAFSYDISSFGNESYNMELILQEYKNGVMDDSGTYSVCFSNRMMISKFSEEDQAQIIEEGSADDAPNGVFRLANKITIGFLPIRGDSVRPFNISLNGKKFMGVHSNLLKVRKVSDAKGGEILSYSIRPFVIDKFETDKFIPLLMLGSYWWDPDANVFRFCGENTLSPDMTSSLFKESPHYYIIGIKFHKE